MKKSLLPALCLFLSCYSLTAQNDWNCGTQPFRMSLPGYALIKNSAVSRLDTATRYIPVTVNFVGDANGSGYLKGSQMLESLCDLQSDFEKYRFHFYLENTQYINHPAFYTMTGSYPYSMEMLTFLDDHNILNTLNIYVILGDGSSFVVWNDTLDLSVPPVMFYPQQHAVVLTKNHMTTRNHTITHEVGHYFGLWHTFNGWEGLSFPDLAASLPDTLHTTYNYNGIPYNWDIPVERVDAGNCADAADYVCDTPPDYLSFAYPCNADKKSILEQTDPTGTPFRSDGTLFMSYSADACQERFSEGQVDWMRAVADGPRSYLLYDQTPPAPFPPEEWTLVYPPDRDTLLVADSVTLQWDVPGADFYLLEFGRIVGSNTHIATLKNVLLDAPIYEVGINPGLRYYWKISAFDKYDLCTALTDTSYFVVAAAVGAEEAPNSRQALRLFPNPVSGRLYWRLPEGVAGLQNMKMQVFDAHGRLLLHRTQPAGEPLDVQHLPPGMYALKAVAGERVYAGRFVKE